MRILKKMHISANSLNVQNDSYTTVSFSIQVDFLKLKIKTCFFAYPLKQLTDPLEGDDSSAQRFHPTRQTIILNFLYIRKKVHTNNFYMNLVLRTAYILREQSTC